jgi:hypothetical protein
MEARDTRMMYYFAHEKFEKYQMNENWCCPAIHQLKTAISLDLLIEDKVEIEDRRYDVYLVPPVIFSQILLNAGLSQEQEIFNKIQETWLERLITDKSLIQLM